MYYSKRRRLTRLKATRLTGKAVRVVKSPSKSLLKHALRLNKLQKVKYLPIVEQAARKSVPWFKRLGWHATKRLGVAGVLGTLAGDIIYRKLHNNAMSKKRARGAFRRRKKIQSNRRLATKGFVRKIVAKNTTHKCDLASYNSVGADIGTLNVVRLGTSISTGFNDGNRDSAVIKLHRLVVRFKVYNPNVSVDDLAYLRIFLLENKIDNSLISDELWKKGADDDIPTNYITTGSTQQINHPFNHQKFRCWWQKRITVPNKDVNNAGRFEKTMCFNIPLGNRTMKWQTLIPPENGIKPHLVFCWFFEGINNRATFTLPLQTEVDTYIYFSF